MTTQLSIYDEVVRLGIPHDSHETDLYIPVTTQTQALIDDYRFRANVSIFRSQTDGALWFDIPFAYVPAWQKKLDRHKKFDRTP